MEDVEQRALRNFHTLIPYWKRYVDDVFTSVRKDLVEEFHHCLSGRQPRINFTKEVEVSRRIEFLDVQVQRKSDGNFATRVYSKPGHTGKYLHCNIYAPMKHKRLVGVTLFKRTLTDNATGGGRKLKEKTIEEKLHEIQWTYSRATIPYVKGQSETTQRKVFQHHSSHIGP